MFREIDKLPTLYKASLQGIRGAARNMSDYRVLARLLISKETRSRSSRQSDQADYWGLAYEALTIARANERVVAYILKGMLETGGRVRLAMRVKLIDFIPTRGVS